MDKIYKIEFPDRSVWVVPVKNLIDYFKRVQPSSDIPKQLEEDLINPIEVIKSLSFNVLLFQLHCKQVIQPGDFNYDESWPYSKVTIEENESLLTEWRMVNPH